jgi:outer membrane protein OmpA-like peptidoglycan-associated protein
MIKNNFSIFIFGLLFLAFSQFSHSQLVNPVVSITGSVMDAVTREPVTAIMIVTNEKGKRINATRSNGTDNGYYYLTSLKPGKKYTITVSSKYYLKAKYTFEIAKTYHYTELSHDFLIMPLMEGAEIPLSFAPFELNKAKLRYGADYVLDGIKSTMLTNPNIKFQIVCYPDVDGNPSHNEKLTKERAQSIQKYLVANGIDALRISIKGNKRVDSKNPPPKKKKAKGKRYIGTTYIKIIEI